MALATGRAGTITDRDRDVLEALFFCRYLSTNQLAWLFFPSRSKARTRLAKLKAKGYVTARTMYLKQPTSWEDRVAAQGIWNLTKAGFESVSESLGVEETYATKPLLPAQALHYVRTAEVYVGVRDILDGELGSYPEWEWRHEKRATYAGEYENASYLHKPDAHVVFRGHTFILERQTAESKIGTKKLYRKVEDHKRFTVLRLKAPAEVLFALDSGNSPLAQQAIRAGEQLGIRVEAGDVPHIVEYLRNAAERLS
ncbi:replication-relaxation family protein [Rubrobacter radiotolerans]|uniref:Replication-relaxation family protein n=1 Tax=Rubrobacter radiotolerans TaxID=42256 RepID=A0AB35T683_RUBRA|nr:replication-relaxation family protein [Rubrobacter radiotolerans]MDX5895176.1 replication-relaxation family protein [Rubrobacter radiotolerans]SMC07595.1 Replication-relaxation [Rubrobacter radiotolerans DSM 5868]